MSDSDHDLGWVIHLLEFAYASGRRVALEEHQALLGEVEGETGLLAEDRLAVDVVVDGGGREGGRAEESECE